MTMRPENDRHHILNSRNDWTSSDNASLLRSTVQLIPRMDRAAHEELHANCSHVPLLGSHALKHVLREFEPTYNTMSTMDRFMSAVDVATKSPKAHPIERDLGQLTIRTVEEQKYYVRQGLILPRNGRRFTIVT